MKRFNFCCRIKSHIENDDDFVNRLMLNAENTFHLNEKASRHNVRTEPPHVVIEHERDSPEVNVFCAISCTRIFGPFFFVENTMTETGSERADGSNFPIATGRIRDFILQQDGALPHFHREVRRFLSEHLPRRWIGRSI